MGDYVDIHNSNDPGDWPLGRRSLCTFAVVIHVSYIVCHVSTQFTRSANVTLWVEVVTKHYIIISRSSEETRYLLRVVSPSGRNYLPRENQRMPLCYVNLDWSS